MMFTRWLGLLALVGLVGGSIEDPIDPLEMTAPEEAAVVQRGGETAALLQRTLGGELLAAIREGGPDRAVEVCSRTALELTRDAGRGYVVKRTSLRYRNPANAPDELEFEVLNLFAAKAREDHPSWYAEKFRRDDGVFFRYYQPLYVADLCLTCHGPASAIPAAVRDILTQRYPDDRANGYGGGDFRGLIRVEIPADSLVP